ncbi:MAG: hypothetical protein ABR964_09785 [Tepidisphaeraceae bacterium]|jgi:CRISPR-associated protein Csb3
MNQRAANVRLAVDPTNPGQYFACCGLLEVADRLQSGAQGWFAGDQFLMACGHSIRQLLNTLLAHPAEPVTSLANGLAVKPIVAPLKITLNSKDSNTLLLDSWMRIRLDKGRPIAMGNPPWNFWSGQQTSCGIWNSLRDEIVRQLPTLADDGLRNLFTQRILLTGRFGFDPGAAWDALDAGFSPNAQDLSVASSPATELLAAVGIQRFRPVVSNDRQSFTYALWPVPLPPAVAACTAAAVPIVPGIVLFRGQVVSRGQYAALGPSTQIIGGFHG